MREFEQFYWLIPVVFVATVTLLLAFLSLKIHRVPKGYKLHALRTFILFPLVARASELEMGIKRGDRVSYPRIRAFYGTPNGYLMAIRSKSLSPWQNEVKRDVFARKLFLKNYVYDVVFSHRNLKSRDALGVIVTPVKKVKIGRPGRIEGETEFIIGQSYLTGDDVLFDYLKAGHTLVSGKSGTGKSVLLKGLVANAEICPEIQVVGIDKTGLILRENSDFSWNGETFILDAVKVAENLVEEMEKRIGFLRKQGVSKIEPSQEMPLFLVVLEEISNTLRALESYDKANGLKPAERLLPRFSNAIEILYAESRKAGFLLLAVTQKADLGNLPAGVRENSKTSLIFKQEINSLKLVLSPENLSLANELNSKEIGAFLYVDGGGNLELCQGDFF